MDRKEIIEAINKERSRQITGEGYFPSKDDTLVNGELGMAAAVYAMPPDDRDMSIWPFGEKAYRPHPTNRTRELVKAAALIVAEIERMDRKGETHGI